MNQTFPSKDNRTWLKEVHESRSQRSLLLGKEAIDLLVKQNLPVTLKTVSEKSKEIDPEGKGIHPNTIRTNEHLCEYYKQHSLTYKQKKNNGSMKPNLNADIDFRKIKPNRSVENTQKKYMKLSKKELVQRLILAEQYIADNNVKWVTKHFETFK
ncbi:hypothetical protein [Bacillus sp. 123MFChir2]|uniref:hypothetical protein n=1 Tax=Bacillus sp. 123MFChir2 TaxID=1169144 RepID=UPI00037B970F|nr:hypothetical protein [Bacillus sp. 123MFChir2]